MPDDASRLTGTPPSSLPSRPAPRRIGAVNWLGVWTLYLREVQRFYKILGQTVLAPVVTTLLFLAVFALALGHASDMVEGVPYLGFLAPGLIMMAMVQNAYSNTSSGMVIMKIQGNVVDLLMAPLSPGELTFGFAMAGVTRGLVVGSAVTVAMALFTPLAVPSPVVPHLGAALFYALAASLLLSLLGLLTGIWASKFDNIAFVTNFVITPFAFLSGTFYSVERLPGIWRTVAQANPFFFMIDGFRYGLTGHADGPLVVGAVVLTVLNVALWILCHALFARGWKLKS